MKQVKTVDKTEQEKIEALAKHLDCSIDEAIVSMDDYLVYTEWYKENGKVIDYKLVDQDGNIITDEGLIEAVQEQVDNMIEE